jgi:hypothetical protein
MRIDSSQLPEIQRRVQDEISEYLGRLRTNEDHVVTMVSHELEALYRMLAVTTFLSEADVVGFHHAMYLAASVRKRFLDCVAAGMKVDQGYLFATGDASMYEGICGGEPALMEALARNQLTTKPDKRFDNAYYYYFAQVLRLLILKMNAPASKFLGIFDNYRKGAREGYSQIVHGILEKDRVRFNEGLKLALAERRSEIAADEDVNVGEQSLSVECIALARIGRSHDLSVDVNDQFLPRELLAPVSAPFPKPADVFPPVPGSFVEVPEEQVASDES